MKLLIAIAICLGLALISACGDNSVGFNYGGLDGAWRWNSTRDIQGNLLDDYDSSPVFIMLDLDLRRGKYSL